MSDCSADMLAVVSQAYANKTGLKICGGGSKKQMLGRALDNRATGKLELTAHTGIIDYQPAELVVTARAGTTIEEINTTLAKEQQTLPFEPPEFSGAATLGGTLACNMSGPARPWRGSIRDMVLGVQLINGRAQLLNFGGQVMKNVAGYDVSRLQAGALGSLGVLTQVSLKVLPVPEHSVTLCFQVDADAAIQQMNFYSAQTKPLSGACWAEGVMYLRLSGTEGAVVQTAKEWGGDRLADSAEIWRSVREFDHPFFSGDAPLWRFSHRPSAAAQQEFGPLFIDWGGAQRWVRGEQNSSALEESAEAAGGHVSLYRGGDRSSEVKHPLNAQQRGLHQRLKHAFDPEGILNPGRLYSWM
jgi:glycolate oxidase FAD binding subunit